MELRCSRIRTNMRVPAILAVVAFVAASACAASDRGEAASSEPRAVTISTAGCGFASSSGGSGVAIGGDIVLVTAHSVLQASDITVEIDGASHPGVVVALDRPRDLALLRVVGLDLPDVETIDLNVGSEVLMIGGLASGSQKAVVTERATVSIEEALGTRRFERLGYQLDVTAADGDSGAGVYDSKGRLGGIIFAVQPDTEFAWATAASEIEPMLNGPLSSFVCDEDTSFLVESPS